MNAEMSKDLWADATFHRDAAVAARQQALRRYDRETRLVPRLRAVGNVLLFLIVCSHNLVFSVDVPWKQLWGYGAFLVLYSIATAYSLRKHYRVGAPVDLAVVYLATDVAVFVLAVYFSGGERSWLLFVLCVRVADQMGTSVRRAMAFTHETLALHILLILYLAYWEERSLSLIAEFVKALGVYMTNFYLSLAAGPLERQRKRAIAMTERTRRLIDELAAKTEELESERARAEAASRAKSQFLANMSHEIRTPMNGVLGAAELLLRSPIEGEQRIWAKTIASSGQALLTLVDDVLDMSKIEAGALRLEQTNFLASYVVQEVIGSLQSQATIKGIALSSETPSSDEPVLLGDPHRLRQVLTNLVGNAIKFTRKGSVRLCMKVVDHTPDRATVHFEVHDTGVGMSEEARQHIFEAFQQADSSTTRQFGGTGLGLTITSQLVEQMGGSIDVQSELGKGSRFGVTLTLPLGDSSALRLSLSTSRRGRTSLIDLGLKVLVAEDTEINRELVKRMLEALACQVITVSDGQQAVELLGNAHDFAIALVDWHMPVLDGLEAVGRIRAAERSQGRSATPILAFTANAFADEAERCLQAGMTGVVHKPLSLRKLQDALLRYAVQTPESAQSSPPNLANGSLQRGAEGPLNMQVLTALYPLDQGSEESYVASLIDGYLDTAAEGLLQLTHALEQQDAAAAREVAHRLRSISGSLGAHHVMAAFELLEKCAAQQDVEGSKVALEAARNEHEAAQKPLMQIAAQLRARRKEA